MKLKSGAKFILWLFALLLFLGAWLAWMTRGALEAKRAAEFSPSSPPGTPAAP